MRCWHMWWLLYKINNEIWNMVRNAKKHWIQGKCIELVELQEKHVHIYIYKFEKSNRTYENL